MDDVVSENESSFIEGEGELLQRQKVVQKKSLCSRMLSWKWKECIIIAFQLVAYTACNMAYSLMTPFFPGEAEQKGVPSIAVGIIMATTQITVVILSPIVGYLLPSVGVVLPVLLGLLLIGLSYILLAFVKLIPSVWGFIVVSVLLRAVEGVGSAMYVTSLFAIVPQLFPKHITITMGILLMAAGVGFLLGVILGAVLYQAGGFQLPFFSLGGFVAVTAIPCALMVWRIRIKRKAKKLPTIVICKVSTDLKFIVLEVVTMISISTFTFYGPSLQPFLSKTFGFNSISVGIILVEISVTYIIASLILSPLIQRLGKSLWFVACGLTVSTLAYILFSMPLFVGFPNVWFVRVAMCLVGIGVPVCDIPAYENLLIVARPYLRKQDNEEALNSFVAGLVSSILLLGECFGLLIGGLLNTFLSFPESSLVCAEILFVHVLLLVGIIYVDKLTNVQNNQNKNLVS